MRFSALALLSGCMLLCSPALGQSLADRFGFAREKRPPKAQAASTRQRVLGVLAYRSITARFDQTPAREAFNDLQAILGINIICRYRDDKIGFGFDPETPITLDVIDKPALHVLELVLEQCQDLGPSTWQIRDGYVEIGTKRWLSRPSAHRIQWYPVGDLLFTGPVFDNAPQLDIASALNQGGGRSGGRDSGGGQVITPPGPEGPRTLHEQDARNLINLITKSVEPDAWVVKGGSAYSIRYHADTLIVRAPDFVHRMLGGYRLPPPSPEPRTPAPDP